MAVLASTGTFVLLLSCLEEGMGVLLLNSLVNSSGQRFVWLCTVIWSGDALPCRNLSARMTWGLGKEFELHILGVQNLFITLV